MNSLDWNDLRYVVAVVQQGSAVAAARTLGVSHATVLRRIQAIEKGIGSPLFDRLASGYLPTDAGRELSEAGLAMDVAITNASRVIEGRTIELSGVVRFTTTDSLGHSIVPTLLAGFRARHPAIRVETLVTNSLLDIDARAADVTLRPTSRPPESWVGMRLVRMDFGIYASASYATRHARTPLPELAWIIPNGALETAPATRWLSTLVSPDRAVAKIDTFVGMAALAREGVGATLLPRFLGEADADLKQLAPASEKAGVDVWILTHPNLKSAGRIAAFVDHVSSGIRDLRKQFEAGPRASKASKR